MRFLLILPITAFAIGGHAQAQQPELASLLRRVGAQAEALEHTLPSFSCTETAVSQEIRPGKDPRRTNLRRVEYTATLRVRRGTNGELNESPEYTIVDGKPFSGGGFVLPAYAEGGFRHALGFFLSKDQPCYRYALSPDGSRIDFAAAPDAAAHPSCHSVGVRGFARLDANGEVTHIERRASGAVAEAHHLIPFAAIDLATVTLNGNVYRLSSHLLTERPNGKLIDRYEAAYTGCKLFTATVTVGPASDVPEGPQP